MISTRHPFVLLDDMRASGCGARLFQDPVDIVRADDLGGVGAALERVREAVGQGLHAAGFLTYEAGYAMEPRLHELARAGAPRVWFGLFNRVQALASGEVPKLLPDPAGAWAAPPQPLVSEAVYRDNVDRVLEAIAAGDIYQANLTFAAEVPIAGDPLALYARLRKRAAAPWGGIVWTGSRWLLSFSPELFFTLEGARLTARPMKGTAPRESDPTRLRDDPKQRAENLMIVDLIRNDLGRVAVTGSVDVTSLFEVETYPTVHQLTSTVTATLRPGLDATDVLRAAFPCGSVTGAPKVRAMEIIAGIEDDARGAYTGSIGVIAPGGDAALNVAIRTLAFDQGADRAMLGLGSGIVADSDPAAEWRECLAKGRFVSEPARFDLLETMRFDPLEGLFEIDRHLARMKASAEQLGFRFDRHGLRNELQAATFWLRDHHRVRVRLSPTGAIAIEVRPLTVFASTPISLAVRPLPVPSSDFRLRHKTSDRVFYDQARRAAGTDEVIFTDPDGFLTEGSFSNLFVARDAGLLTPPAVRGLLPGILRAQLLDCGKAIEADLRAEDLGGALFIGNALRGLVPAALVAVNEAPGL